MSETVAVTDAPDNLGSPRDDQGVPGETLEQRLRRLEDALAGLQDVRHIEDRVVERISRQKPAPPTAAGNSSSVFSEAGRSLLPSAMDFLPGATRPSAPRTWLPFDLYGEARAMFYMFVDPRYRLSWEGRIIPPVIVGLIVFSWVWVPGAVILYGVSQWLAILLVKAVDLLLALVMYKVLSREAARYRATAEELPPYFRP
jgi:hypothetical protein